MAVQLLPPQVPQGPGAYFKPNSWAQWQALRTTAPEVLYSGRYGSSKSRTLTEKADYYARQFANARIILARKRRVDLGLTTLRILLEQTVTPNMVAWGWHKSADGGSSLFYPNGSQIVAVGLDEPLKLKSGEFDLILVDQAEEIDEEEWNAASGRLRNKAGTYRQIIGACNPESPAHWLYRKFDPTRSHRAWTTEPTTLPNGEIVPVGTLVLETIMAGARDNMENLPTDYLARLSRYRGTYYQRYVLGLWVAFEGQVYDCFTPDLHVVPRPKAWQEWGGYPPPDWGRHRGIDFGYVNPFVCQWWAVDPDDNWWLYREIYMSRRTVAQHGEQIKACESHELATLNKVRHERDPKLPPLRWLNIDSEVSDHDAEDRATLDNIGITTAPANKDVSPGIQTVYSMMVPFEVDGKLRTRVRFVADALVEKDWALDQAGKPFCTHQEVGLLRYRNPPKSSTVGNAAPEEIFKENDHGCDTMRYVLHTWNSSPRPSVYTIG